MRKLRSEFFSALVRETWNLELKMLNTSPCFLEEVSVVFAEMNYFSYFHSFHLLNSLKKQMQKVTHKVLI